VNKLYKYDNHYYHHRDAMGDINSFNVYNDNFEKIDNIIFRTQEFEDLVQEKKMILLDDSKLAYLLLIGSIKIEKKEEN